MVRECCRILKPGGVVRIVTPSLGFLLRVMSPDRGHLERDYFTWSVKACTPEAPILANAFFLNNFVRNWGHLFIYDRETLSFILNDAGFVDAKECPFNQSAHDALRGLENGDRMAPGFLELESMVWEATKPDVDQRLRARSAGLLAWLGGLRRSQPGPAQAR
jgi:hypothetical protein